MSHSRKDGRHGGGHDEARRTGREYWSPRPPCSMGEPCKETKAITHRAERRLLDIECAKALAPVQTYPPFVHASSSELMEWAEDDAEAVR